MRKAALETKLLLLLSKKRTHLLIETVAKLGYSAGDLVEVDRFTLAVAFHNIEGHGESGFVMM